MASSWGSPLGMNLSHPTISSSRPVSMDRVIQCGGSWPGTCPEGPGPRLGPDLGVIVGGGSVR